MHETRIKNSQIPHNRRWPHKVIPVGAWVKCIKPTSNFDNKLNLGYGELFTVTEYQEGGIKIKPEIKEEKPHFYDTTRFEILEEVKPDPFYAITPRRQPNFKEVA